MGHKRAVDSIGSHGPSARDYWKCHPVRRWKDSPQAGAEPSRDQIEFGRTLASIDTALLWNNVEPSGGVK